MTTPPIKTQRQIRGNSAEALARSHLIHQGLDFFQANFRCKTGEIDLIFWDQQTLVFVEVRFRQDLSHGSPLDTITLAKQRKIKRAAQFFLQGQFGDHWPPCRFDVVGISGQLGSDPTVDWIQHAFY